MQQLNLSLRTLVYDGTNFFTFINTRTPARLPARGHKKQHRGDLRQVSLGALVSTDFHVPLFHLFYTGNLTDATAFLSVSEELAQRYRQLAQGCERITLIFDKGNNSKEAFQTLEATPFHFIGSLVPSQHPDLLRVPLEKFQALAGPRLASCLAYRTGKKVLGLERTIVITYNENVLEGQLQGIQASLTKAQRRLDELQANLRRRREGRLSRAALPRPNP
jgi:transposase